MVSYNSILCDHCGDKVYGEFFGEPNSSSHGVRGPEKLPISVAASSSVVVLNEATVDLVLLAALEQFEDQATIGCYSLHWRDVKTQAQHNKRG